MLTRLDLRGLDPATDLADVLPRPNIVGDGPRAAVREIIARVRSDGDAVLRELTEKFDGVTLDELEVSEAELDAAVAGLSPELRQAMEVAIDSIEAFHQHQVRAPETVTSEGMAIKSYQRPIRRAGLYVPGGRAAYPSTVLMTAVPARVAVVSDIVLCVPPNAEDGGVTPSALAAARLAGVSRVFSVGGTQAIAAMAYGTESVPAADVIAGPGNVYVALAKQEVSADVGIAADFAGPSEVVVVADGSASPEFAAIDVILQAEHGPDGLAWLVAWDEAVVDSVCAAGDRLLADAPRADEVRATLADGGYAALVDDLTAAIRVVDANAPEHLELQCAGAEELAETVNNTGAIFCGDYSPASLGDFVAGPSHVLPTFGSARFANALTVADFVKDYHVVTVEPAGLARLGPHTINLAEQEGLDAHAESIRPRLAAIDGQQRAAGGAGA